METTRYGFESLQQFDRLTDERRWKIYHCRFAFNNRQKYLLLYAHFVSYLTAIFLLTIFIDEWIVLNNFVKRHLGLKACDLGSCLPICVGWYDSPWYWLHPVIKEEIVEDFRASRTEWIKNEIPEIELDTRQP